MTYQPDYTRVEGSNYAQTADLDIKEVAKLIRKDLKTHYKGYKFSVRISGFSGGQSLGVVIKEIPDSLTLYNPEWLQQIRTTGHYPYDLARNSPEAIQLCKDIRSIVQSYNYDGSDSQTDYFNVRFYTHVDFDSDLFEARKATE